MADLMQFWNPAWVMDGAGLGSIGPGWRNLPGSTYLDGEVLVTFPRDIVRGLVMRRRVEIQQQKLLTVEVSAEPGTAWQLDIFANDEALASRIIEKDSAVEWSSVQVDLGRYAGQLRLFQRALIPGKTSGSARWRRIHLGS